MLHEGLEDTNSASTEFGAAVNNYFNLDNVNKGHPTHNLRVDHPGYI